MDETRKPTSTEDDGSDQAGALLRGVAGASAQLAAFRRALQDIPQVTRIDHEFDCIGTDEFPSTPKGVLSWWIEAAYSDGTSRCFSLDLYRDVATWIVETGITVPGRDGPEPLVILPERRAATIAGCLREVTTAIDVLWRVAATYEGQAGRHLAAE
jgi:hypothetical protein